MGLYTVDQPLTAQELDRWHGAGPPATVADVVAEQLARWGVRFVFGLPGEDNLCFLDAVHRHPHLQFCGVRHEAAAAIMTAATAKLTGQLAVCTATSGPGIAQLINGIADAYSDKVPLLAVTGQVERRYIARPRKQYVDQQSLLGSITSSSILLTDPQSVVPLLTESMRTAYFQRTATHLSVPRDLWTQAVDPRIVEFEPYLFTQPRSPSHVVYDAARWLMESERPLLVAGVGAKAAMSGVVALAEKLSAPMIHTLGTAGHAPWQHPLAVGSLGKGGTETAAQLLAEADWVLRIGTNWWPPNFTPQPNIHPGGAVLGSGPRIMAVDSRPDQIGRGPGAIFGLVGDAGDILSELHTYVHHRPRPHWEARVQGLRTHAAAQLSSEAQGLRASADGAGEGPGAGIHPARIMSELNGLLPAEAVICLDVGDHVLWFNRHFQGNGQDILISGTWRTMGFALPAALAAKLVQPHRPVVVITGDGGLTMSIQELGTAVQNRLPVTVILFQNGVLATEAHQARMEGLYPAGVRLHNPDFCKLIKAWGGAGYAVRKVTDIAPQVRNALTSDRISLVDIPTRSVPLPTLTQTPPVQGIGVPG